MLFPCWIDQTTRQPMRITGWVVALVLWLATPLPAQATLSSSQLEQVALSPRANAQLPLQTPLSDPNERSAPLQAWLGGLPTVWILADYTCETLCGPAISIVSNALADTGLSAGIARGGDFEIFSHPAGVCR